MIISLVTLQAGETQRITNMHQIFNTIGKTADDILLFAKKTLEELPHEQQEISELFLGLPGEVIKADNKIETIGRYLNATSDKVLRIRIGKDPETEGKVLLNDFLKTVVYKALRKKIEMFVTAMTSCAFLTSKESNLLRELKLFYPEHYGYTAYTWEPSFKNGTLDTLVGRFHKSFGLKNNLHGDNLIFMGDDFIAIVDITYICCLRHVEERIGHFKGSNIENVGPRFKPYIEPRHEMTISITFLCKGRFEGSAVSYRCYALGGERIFAAADDVKEWFGKDWKSSTCSCGDNHWAPIEFDLDLQASVHSPSLDEDFLITSAGSILGRFDSSDLFPATYIIKAADGCKRTQS